MGMMKFSLDVDVELIDGPDQPRVDVGFVVCEALRRWVNGSMIVQGERQKKRSRYKIVYVALREDGV